jgi:hypothetical protein
VSPHLGQFISGQNHAATDHLREGATGVRTAPSRPRLLERDFNSPSDTVLPLHRSANRRMIAGPGGSYDVPAFRPTSQSRSAVTAYSWIPHTTTRAILDQAEIGEHLDLGGRINSCLKRHSHGVAELRAPRQGRPTERNAA